MRNSTAIVIFAGGGKADSYKKILGNSYGLWIATEINEHYDSDDSKTSFIKVAMARQLASKSPKIYWDLNPSNPLATIYTQYLDNWQDKGLIGGYNYEHFTIYDNKAITEERKKEIVSQYDPSSIWYQRDILGKRVVAEGLIYQEFKDYHIIKMSNWNEIDNNGNYVNEDRKALKFITVGVDFGGNISAHSFIATGFTNQFRKFITLKQKRIAERIDDKVLTEEFVKFIKELRNSNEEGDKMGDEIKNSEVQELDNSVEHKTVSVSVSSYTDKYDDNGNYIGSEDESHRKSVSTVTKVDDEKTVDNADCDDKETNAEVDNSNANNEVVVEENNSDNSATDDTCDYQAMYNSAQETIANLTAELNTLKNSYSEMEVKCSALEEYKANKETEEMTKAVNCAIAEVADCFSASEIEEWKAKAVNCSNIDAFKNEIKASAFDKQKKSTTSIRNPIPMDFAENKIKTNEALWDRVANEVNK